MRLQSGLDLASVSLHAPKGKGTKGKGKESAPQVEVPLQLRHEQELGINVLGVSLANLPKEIMMAFLSGMDDCFELDLDCAHHQCSAHRHGSHYFQETKDLRNNSTEYRQRLAETLDTSVDIIKQIMLVQIYAGSTKTLQEANGIAVLPPPLRRFGVEMKKVHALDAILCPKGVALAQKQGRDRPDVTNHCWMNEASERVLVELMRSGVTAVGGRLAMPRGDGAILQGVDRARILKYMAEHDVKVSVKELPKSWDDFCDAVKAASAQKGRTSHRLTPACEFKDLQQVEAARYCLLQRPEVRDELTIARSVMRFVTKLFCETASTNESKEKVKNTEWFSETEGRWHWFGGDERLDNLIETSLRMHFQRWMWKFVTVVDEELGSATKILQPVPDPTDGLCGHVHFIKKMTRIVCQQLRTKDAYKMPALNKASTKLLHFRCGQTLDFSLVDKDGDLVPPPCEEQLRRGRPEDRNTRSTGQPWRPCYEKVATQICEVVDLYCKLLQNGLTSQSMTSIIQRVVTKLSRHTKC